MGMFDYIKDVTVKCPFCDERVSGFQSKDRDCELKSLSFDEVNYFCAACHNCEAWLSFRYDPPDAPQRKLSDYTFTAEERFPDNSGTQKIQKRLEASDGE